MSVDRRHVLQAMSIASALVRRVVPGESLRGMIHAVEGLLPLVNWDTVVVPGHGPIGNRESLLGFRDMLCSTEGGPETAECSRFAACRVLRAAPTGISTRSGAADTRGKHVCRGADV